MIEVLGIAGSLRADSFNRMLLHAAREVAPGSVNINVAGLQDIPLYNADDDTDERRPQPVRTLKQQVTEADALLIATPEYNHSVPGVLQNAIDWVSRPALQSPLKGRRVAMIGASTSLIGTARAQQQLKLVLLSTHADVMPHRGVLVTQARERFENGRLSHAPTREFLRAFLVDLEKFVSS